MATAGRNEQRASAAARGHTPMLDRFYRYRLPPITPGQFEFHLDLLRPKLPAFSLDTLVDTFEWIDEQAVLTGSMTLHRPRPEDPTSLPISRGHRIRCRVLWAGGQYELWTMRVKPPEAQIDQGTVNITLEDDMVLLEGGVRDWIFRRTKRRPFGYTATEVTHLVAAALGAKVGQVASSSKRQTLTLRKSSALAVLRQVWAQEKTHSGESYVIRMRDGRVEVVPLQRNSILYVLGDQIQTALITQKAGVSQPTTVLTGRGRVGKGSQASKVTFTAYDRRVVGLLGAKTQTKDYGRVDSHADLRERVKRDLAAGLRTTDKVTIQHQGIPFIVRGDGIKLDLPQEGFSGDQAFVYATRADHVVQAGTYQTTWDFAVADPYLGKLTAAQAAADARAAVRAKRKRTSLKAGK